MRRFIAILAAGLSLVASAGDGPDSHPGAQPPAAGVNAYVCRAFNPIHGGPVYQASGPTLASARQSALAACRRSHPQCEVSCGFKP